MIALAPLTFTECRGARRVRDETRRDLARILSAGDADRRVIVELRRFVDTIEAALAVPGSPDQATSTSKCSSSACR